MGTTASEGGPGQAEEKGSIVVSGGVGDRADSYNSDGLSAVINQINAKIGIVGSVEWATFGNRLVPPTSVALSGATLQKAHKSIYGLFSPLLSADLLQLVPNAVRTKLNQP